MTFAGSKRCCGKRTCRIVVSVKRAGGNGCSVSDAPLAPRAVVRTEYRAADNLGLDRNVVRVGSVPADDPDVREKRTVWVRETLRIIRRGRESLFRHCGLRFDIRSVGIKTPDPLAAADFTRSQRPSRHEQHSRRARLPGHSKRHLTLNKFRRVRGATRNAPQSGDSRRLSKQHCDTGALRVAPRTLRYWMNHCGSDVIRAVCFGGLHPPYTMSV